MKDHSAHRAVVALINSLKYDFNHFSMTHFIQHGSQYRGKDIIARTMHCDENLFGIWFPQETADYICVNKSLHPTHKIHVLLHEMAHIFLDHARIPLRCVLSPELIQELGLKDAAGRAKHAPRKLMLKSPEEQEAEVFSFLVQERVIAANRWHELTANDSSIDALLPILNVSVS